MRGVNRFLLFMTLFCCANVGLMAQNDTVYRFSLEAAQQYAVDNYYLSKNAQLDIEGAKKQLWEYTAMGLPQLSGNVDYTHMPEIPEVFFPQTVMGANKGDNEPVVGGDFRDPDFYSLMEGEPIMMGVPNNVSYGLMLNQIIFSGEYIVGLQASRVLTVFSQENYEKVRIDILQNVADNYFAVKIVGKNVEVLEETLENLKLNYEHTAKFLEQGLVEDTDVDQLNIIVKRTENSLRTVVRQEEYLLKMLKYQLGLPANTNIELKDELTALLNQNIIVPADYIFNLEENIDYRLLDTNSKLKDLSMKREKSTFLPSINGFYQYSGQVNSPDFNTNIPHILGVGVTVPILSSGMRLAKVGQARIEYDKAINQRDQESERLVLVAEQAKYDYEIALQNYYTEQENFELSKRVFDKSNIRYKEGILSSLDLSLINNQYLEAELSYSTAIQNLLNAKVAMDRAFNKL